MSKVTALLIGLAWLSYQSLSFAAEIYDERMVPEFNEIEWIAAHASATAEQFIVEYVIRGESLEQWTELVSIVLIPVKPADGLLVSMRDYYKKKALKQCSKAFWEEIYSSDSTIICVWDLEKCLGQEETEYTLTVFKYGVNGSHVLNYSARSKEVFEKEKSIWVKLLKASTAFYPDESKSIFERSHLSDTSKMIEVTYRYDSPSFPDNSFIAKPRRVWRAGVKYFRSEELPDSANQLHSLMIADEPDAWMINLFNHKGKHMVDPGPTYSTICPVFGELRDDGLTELEFGEEYAFFEYYGARQISSEKIDNVDCDVFELPRLYWILRLYLKRDNGLPYLITRRGQDGSTMSVYFDEYSVDHEIDHQLFVPPANVDIEEN